MTNWHTKPSVCGTFILPHQSWCMHQPRRKRSDFVDLIRLVWTLKHLIALIDSNSIWLICKLNKLPYYGCYCSTLQIHVSPAIDGLLLNWNTSELHRLAAWWGDVWGLQQQCVRSWMPLSHCTRQAHQNTETRRRQGATRHTFNRSFYSNVFQRNEQK